MRSPTQKSFEDCAGFAFGFTLGKSEQSSWLRVVVMMINSRGSSSSGSGSSRQQSKLHSHSLFAWLFAFNEASSDAGSELNCRSRGCAACILQGSDVSCDSDCDSDCDSARERNLRLSGDGSSVSTLRRCCCALSSSPSASPSPSPPLTFLWRVSRIQNINRCACREMRIVFIEDLSGGTFSSLILTRCWWYRDSKHEIPQFVGQCSVQCTIYIYDGAAS